MDFGELVDGILEAERSDSFMENVMESPASEALNGSLTNELVETQVGTVLKRFSSRPSMAYVQMLGRVLSGKLEYQDQESRIENERRFRSFAESIDVYTPEILGVKDEYIEFEKVKGTDLNTYLNQAENQEAEKAGRKVGSFLNEVHDSGGALTDLRVNNFLLQDEGQLAFVDAEYFSEDATSWERKMDLITLISSVKQVDHKSYDSFLDGFKQEYRSEKDFYTEAISSVTAPGHAALLERNPERLKNAFYNSFFTE
ncbi:MAG: hypothetical protein ABEJ83_05500 [Candidatus Nanohaloarchaea archaeon]